MILETHGLTRRFGGLTALNRVDLKVEEGQVFAIIGPNGSGKTTFFNCVSGVIPASDGRIVFKGDDITSLPAHRVIRRGLARTFQTIRLFRSLSVLDNVLASRHSRTQSGVWDAVLHTKRLQREQERSLTVAREALEFVGLLEMANASAISLPYGLQRRLEIARALAAEPDLILLDEPAAGMNPSEVDSLLELILRIRANGITVMLIEHQMRLAMGVADRMVVFDYGSKISEGAPDEVQNDQRVIEAYLGTEAE